MTLDVGPVFVCLTDAFYYLNCCRIITGVYFLSKGTDLIDRAEGFMTYLDQLSKEPTLNRVCKCHHEVTFAGKERTLQNARKAATCYSLL